MKKTHLLLSALLASCWFSVPPASAQPLVNLGLVGMGRVSSETFDQLGPFVDTLGGVFSAMSLAHSTLTQTGSTYSATIYGLSDRGFNSGLTDYHNRFQTFAFSITPFDGPFPAASQDQIQLINIGTSVLKNGGETFTGALPDDTNVLTRPQTLLSGLGGGKTSLDSEGLARLGDGTFYVGDEYGPFIYHFDCSNQLLNVLIPPDAYIPKVGATYPRAVNYFVTLVATNDSGRFENRGFEGLSLTPDGKKLVVMLQAPLAQDGNNKGAARNTRILIYDVDTNSLSYNQPVGEYIYQLTLNGAEALNKNTPISELLAMNDHQFLVLERDSRGRGGDPGSILYKQVVLADISGASNILGSGYDLEKGAPGQLSLPRSGLPSNIVAAARQDVIDIADPKQLAKFGLNTKTNWDANTLNEKWEGLAILPLNDPAAPNDYLVLIGNDNDFLATNVYHNGVIVGTNTVNVDTMMLAFRIGEDHTPPTLTCPTNGVSVPAGTNCSLPNVTSFVTATDNSAPAVKLTQIPAIGTALGLGTFDVTVTGTDAAGNKAACTFSVTIVDPPPIVTAPAVVTIAADANCQAAIPNLLVATNVSALDNCGDAVTLTQNPDPGTLVGIGTNKITLVATDATFHSVTSKVSFVVVDRTPPTVTCPSDVTLTAGADCHALVPDLLSGVVTSDLCSLPVTLSQSPTNGAAIGVGTNKVVITATDAAGNTATCDANVIVLPSDLTIQSAVIIRWNCGQTLQGGDRVDGPYSDIPDATSPYVVPAAEAKHFYRVRN